MKLRFLLPVLLAAGLAPAGAFWQSRDSNYNQNVVSGGGGRTCTDGTHSANFLARTSGLSNADQDNYCTLINGLDTDGLFALGDQLLILAAPDSTTSLLNLLSTSYSATLVNAPTFTANVGYAGGATKQIDTHFNASTAGGQYNGFQASFLVFTNNSYTSGQDSGGAYGYLTNTSPNVGCYPHFSDNNFYCAAQSSVGWSVQVYLTNAHFMGFAKDANLSPGSFLYQNTTGGAASEGDATGSLINDNFALLADTQGGGGALRPLNGSLRASWIGGALTAAQQSNLYTRLCTFLTTASGSC